jgi:Na+/phosphate symporter
MKLLQTMLFIAAGLLANAAVWADALDPRAQSLKKQLNLTEPQTQELDKLFKETRAAQKALRKELQDLAKKQEERMKAVFTPEQAEKYEQINKPLDTEALPAPPPMSPEPGQRSQ